MLKETFEGLRKYGLLEVWVTGLMCFFACVVFCLIPTVTSLDTLLPAELFLAAGVILNLYALVVLLIKLRKEINDKDS